MGTGKQNLSKTCSNSSKQSSKNYDQYSLASFCFPLYQTLQFLKFNDIVKLQLAKIMHSVHNNNISNLYFGFSKIEKFHHYCTRTSTKSNFVQTSARTEKGKSTISFTGPKIWRAVPYHMKNLSNNSFKYQYKRRLLNHYTE